mmetsp:Transcript_149303/g.416130  ORF Transcript_149303/g.416130 Transcript_149303/m.416130 type:complete len:490 (-) Transcript_149303:42-1511(-)
MVPLSRMVAAEGGPPQQQRQQQQQQEDALAELCEMRAQAELSLGRLGTLIRMMRCAERDPPPGQSTEWGSPTSQPPQPQAAHSAPAPQWPSRAPSSGVAAFSAARPTGLLPPFSSQHKGLAAPPPSAAESVSAQPRWDSSPVSPGPLQQHGMAAPQPSAAGMMGPQGHGTSFGNMEMGFAAAGGQVPPHRGMCGGGPPGACGGGPSSSGCAPPYFQRGPPQPQRPAVLATSEPELFAGAQEPHAGQGLGSGGEEALRLGHARFSSAPALGRQMWARWQEAGVRQDDMGVQAGTEVWHSPAAHSPGMRPGSSRDVFPVHAESVPPQPQWDSSPVGHGPPQQHGMAATQPGAQGVMGPQGHAASCGPGGQQPIPPGCFGADEEALRLGHSRFTSAPALGQQHEWPGTARGSNSPEPRGRRRSAQHPWPSIGSVQHHTRECKPCLFWYRGMCQKGRRCLFCHIPHDLDEVNRIRPSKKTRDLLASADAPQSN